MKQSFLILLSILSSSQFVVVAQEYGGEFSELPEVTLRRALEMKILEQDSSAEAVLLYDLAEIEVVPAGTKLHYLRRIKIFNKSAYDKWGNVTLYVQKLGFTKINGFTCNLEDGQIVKTYIGESQIFKSSHNKEWDKYTFAMPNVKEGTVIEYNLKTVIDFYTLPTWKFQHSIPVLWSEYDLNNSIVSFRADLGGSLKVNYEPPKGRKPHRWSIANTPSFKEEPFMPNADFFRTQLYLWAYSPSWRKIVERIWAHKYFKPIVNGQDFLLPIAKDVGGGLAVDPRNRIKNLVEYLKNNVKWNGTYDYFSDDPELILKLKQGSSGDINLLLGSLLAKAGITVNAVLISTRENGHYHEDIPSLQQFNYLICQTIIGTDTLYIDATERGLRYDALPVRCLNQRGLSINKESASWVTIKPLFKNKVTAEADFTLQKSGELNGKLTIIRDGYAGYTSRQKYLTNKENYYQASLNGAWQLHEKHYENESDYEKPFNEFYNLTIDTHSNDAGDFIYINPFLALAEEFNPFKENLRKYPIEYELAEEKTFIGKITIPEGYTVHELPQSKVIATPDNGVKCVFNFSQSSRQIHVLTRFQVNRTFFPPEEFEALKEFYSRVAAKNAEQIVLRKQ